jgi:hypothetical protein
MTSPDKLLRCLVTLSLYPSPHICWICSMFTKIPYIYSDNIRLDWEMCAIHWKWRAGENPIWMSGSLLCVPRNKIARPRYFYVKQNYNVLSPNFHIQVSVSNWYIPRIGLPQQNRQTDTRNINRAHIHECRNWEWGSTVSFLGIHKSDFRYSVS